MKRRDSKHRPVTATEVVQIPLLPDMVAEVKSIKISFEDLVYSLIGMAEQGYSLNFTYDFDREQFSARLAGIDDRATNAGKLLYGNGKTIEGALLALYAKHFLVSRDGNWVGSSNDSSDMS